MSSSDQGYDDVSVYASSTAAYHAATQRLMWTFNVASNEIDGKLITEAYQFSCHEIVEAGSASEYRLADSLFRFSKYAEKNVRSSPLSIPEEFRQFLRGGMNCPEGSAMYHVFQDYLNLKTLFYLHGSQGAGSTLSKYAKDEGVFSEKIQMTFHYLSYLDELSKTSDLILFEREAGIFLVRVFQDVVELIMAGESDAATSQQYMKDAASGPVQFVNYLLDEMFPPELSDVVANLRSNVKSQVLAFEKIASKPADLSTYIGLFLRFGSTDFATQVVHDRPFRTIFPELQKAYDRHIRVKNEIPKGLRFRDGFDLNAFDVILYEIVDNMVKYHDFEKTDRYILFDAEYRQETGQYVIVLGDNGMGIEDKERVWEWAYRESHRHPGIVSPGIGLTHVEALVESLGGEIELESTVGEGTRFRIILKPGDVINSSRGDPSPTSGTTPPPASMPPESSDPVAPATSGGSMTETSAVGSLNYSEAARSYEIDEKATTGNASVVAFENGGDVTGTSYRIYTRNADLRTKQRLEVNRTMIDGYSVYLKSSTALNVITRQFTSPHVPPRLPIR